MSAEQKTPAVPALEVVVIAVGELLSAAIVCLIFLLFDQFSFRVPLGALLGAVVSTANFILLCLAVDRASAKVMAERGDGEMTEEESAAFAAEHQNKLAAVIRLSFFVRMAIMIAALLIGFFSGWFDPVAALVTMLPWRLLLTLGSLIRKKRDDRNAAKNNETNERR